MGLAVTKQEQFWEACGFGNWYRVKKFIEEDGVDVNKISYTNNSYPIHVASQGKAECVKLLIEANCDVNVKDENERLALHHAAMKGHADIIFMLIDAGSEISAQDKNGWTPLISAGYWAFPEAVWTLIDRGADVNLKNKDDRNVLHEVCRSPVKDKESDLGEITQFLLNAKIDMNTLAAAEGWMEADFTPLMFSAYHGHTGVAKVLLDKGCETNTQGISNNWCALHWAANRGHQEMVELLMEYNCDANLKGFRDERPLNVAKTPEIKHVLAPYTEGFENIGFIRTERRPSVTTDEGSASESEPNSPALDRRNDAAKDDFLYDATNGHYLDDPDSEHLTSTATEDSTPTVEEMPEIPHEGDAAGVVLNGNADGAVTNHVGGTADDEYFDDAIDEGLN
ncbi:serine/threonine-protein phosphatase 6 regulatory ankyrin repeat subunit A-like isoform X2 [Lineus longissimus]